MRLAVLVGCAVAVTPMSVLAGNGAKPRTLVQWNDVPCMTLVDRSQQPVLHLDYDIPSEDVGVTPDEVDDSRTHQFFTTCRTSVPLDILPSWITPADVAAATAKALLPNPVPPSQILEGNADWADCWTRITADDDRRPITFEMAAAGVDWDTSGLVPGAYTVHGYTYEPALNLWVQRPGVVKIHDGDPDAAGPAAAITTGELSLYRDEVAQIEGCVDAPAGTTVTAEWTPADELTPEWTAFVSDAPIDGDAFALAFTPPEEIFGGTAAVRATFSSPSGRSYTTMMAAMIVVLDVDAPGCDTGGGFVDDPCGESDGGSEAGSESEGTAATGTESPEDEHTDDGSGCACANDRSPARDRGLVVFVALAVSATVGRRRCPAAPPHPHDGSR
ncbi:MAG TPA: hypothetical protein VFG69_15430 [Nannocystaceae bacterium]|nr:hypothetical protein [Nannocystaceae bacterium]